MWLAEFAPRMYVEINPEDASALGVADGSEVWLATPEGARVHRGLDHAPGRSRDGLHALPFGGWFREGGSQRPLPAGHGALRGQEAANTAMTYGYDVVDSIRNRK